MKNNIIQSRSWRGEHGDILRLETDGHQVTIVRAIATITKTEIKFHHYESFSQPYDLDDVIGFPSIVSNLGDCGIPQERWADLSRQIVTGENWRMEGKI